jgi:hypothetical protein
MQCAGQEQAGVVECRGAAFAFVVVFDHVMSGQDEMASCKPGTRGDGCGQSHVLPLDSLGSRAR